jgi:radical SAM superfamily enzyme YgiQ (UPF0313 family)
MRVLLVYPDFVGMQMNLDSFAWIAEPLPLEVLASYLKHHDVMILDKRFGPPLQEVLISFKPHVVGFTCHITECYSVIKDCQNIKALDPEVITFVGGHFPTLNPSTFNVPWVDAIVTGEGEYTFQDVLALIEAGKDWKQVEGLMVRDGGRQRSTGMRPLIGDLNKALLPRRDLVDRSNYNLFLERPHAIAEFTRGCTHLCKFCSVHKFGRNKYRRMNATRIIKELSDISEQTVAIIDDNFFCDLQRAEDVADAIVREGLNGKRYFLWGSAEFVARRPDIIEKWRDAGLAYFYMGIEAIGELSHFNKPIGLNENVEAIHILKHLDIDLVASLIVTPDFEIKDFDRMVEFVIDNDIKYPLFPILTPFPGTDLWYEQYDKIINHNYSIYDYLHCVFETRLPRDAFYHEYSRLYERIGRNGRSRRLKWYTLKRSFPSSDIRHWPSKLAVLFDFYKKWSTCGTRLKDYKNYLIDDLATPPIPECGDRYSPSLEGCSRAPTNQRWMGKSQTTT